MRPGTGAALCALDARDGSSRPVSGRRQDHAGGRKCRAHTQASGSRVPAAAGPPPPGAAPPRAASPGDTSARLPPPSPARRPGRRGSHAGQGRCCCWAVSLGAVARCRRPRRAGRAPPPTWPGRAWGGSARSSSSRTRPWGLGAAWAGPARRGDEPRMLGSEWRGRWRPQVVCAPSSPRPAEPACQAHSPSRKRPGGDLGKRVWGRSAPQHSNRHMWAHPQRQRRHWPPSPPVTVHAAATFHLVELLLDGRRRSQQVACPETSSAYNPRLCARCKPVQVLHTGGTVAGQHTGRVAHGLTLRTAHCAAASVLSLPSPPPRCCRV